MGRSEPLVSIVTPTYNSERYLAECIESVIAQTHSNWEYVIVDNLSQDKSLDIAEAYAAQDERIRVCVNHEHHSVIPDWNYSMRQISADSQYCKVVHSDDWLFPDCISAMVAVAMQSDTIGLVSAYRLNGTHVDLDGLPYPSTITSGHEIGRLSLARNPIWLFGSPSSVLYRADLVRSRERFYDESILHADTDICFDLLQNWDFGFVHRILTYSRLHEESITSKVNLYGTRRLERVFLTKRYGPVFLDADEYNDLLEKRVLGYHNFLVQNLFKPRPADFWSFHREKSRKLGVPIKWTTFIKPLIRETTIRLTPFAQPA